MKKETMGTVIAKYNEDFVNEFKEACKKLDVKQPAVIRKAMQEVINKANKL